MNPIEVGHTSTHIIIYFITEFIDAELQSELCLYELVDDWLP